jgi:hypothetical protein
MHLDLVGPLPTSPDGFSYIFTMIDRTSRWLEAVPVKDITADTCVQIFVATWVARFGVPSTITTDRGTQFTSQQWSQLCRSLGSSHTTTTAYHPQSNGMIERAHRQMKEALRARGASTDWPAHLPWVLLGLRAAPKEISGVSSAEAVFGQQLVMPGELTEVSEAKPTDFVRRLKSHNPPVVQQPKTWAQVVASEKQPLQKTSMVYIRKCGAVPPLAPAYDGPFAVEQHGSKFWKVRVGDRLEIVTVDRLKPHRGQEEVMVAVPPKCGRPRKT